MRQGFALLRTGLGVTLLIAVAVAVLPGCGEDPVQWDLVWEDEFEGTAVDTNMWTFDVGDGCPSLCGWGNNELEYYRAENATVSSGILSITAREEAVGTRAYTSAKMVTKNKGEWNGGKFEARIKLPVGQGIWPAFWLLGANIDEVGWPECGEIDIMEYRGQRPNVVSGALHGPEYSGGGSINGEFQKSGAGFNQDFHIFSVEWEADAVTWLVDDVPYQTVRPGNLPQGTRWVFNQPFYLILNLAVGGNFVGPPDATTVFPQTMQVDWVRVYRRKS